jgi:hypothetical protein
MFACDVCDCRNIGYFDGRIGGRFQKQQLGIGFDCLFHCFQIGCIHVRGFHSEAGKITV